MLATSKTLLRCRGASLIVQKARGTGTWYQATAPMLGDSSPTARLAQADGELATQWSVGAGLSSNPPGLSSNLGALSSNLGPQDSNPRDPDLREDPLADPRRQALLNELPGALAARVGAIGQRRPPQEVQDLVVTLCELRPWRAEEIAALMGRNVESVRQNYLRPLLRAGRIAMTRPDKPNDPDQAYRA